MKTYTNTMKLGTPEKFVFWTAPNSDYKIAFGLSETIHNTTIGNSKELPSATNSIVEEIFNPPYIEKTTLANRTSAEDKMLSGTADVTIFNNTTTESNRKLLPVADVLDREYPNYQQMTDEEFAEISGKVYIEPEILSKLELSGETYISYGFTSNLQQKIYTDWVNGLQSGGQFTVRYVVTVTDEDGNVIQTDFDTTSRYFSFATSSGYADKTYNVNVKKQISRASSKRRKYNTKSGSLGVYRVDWIETLAEQNYSIVNRVSDSTVWDKDTSREDLFSKVITLSGTYADDTTFSFTIPVKDL